MKDFARKYLQPHRVIPVIILIVSNAFVYYGTKLINNCLGREYLNLTSSLDTATPFIPFFSLVYVSAYPFWYLTYYFLCSEDTKTARGIVIANVLAKLLSGAIFIIMPTCTVRPEITGTGFGAFVLNIVYNADTPVNLFPSIHCLESWFCFTFTRNKKNWPVGVRIYIFLHAFAICLSTVFTAQHVWIDILGGILVAELFSLLMPHLTGKPLSGTECP